MHWEIDTVYSVEKMSILDIPKQLLQYQHANIVFQRIDSFASHSLVESGVKGYGDDGFPVDILLHQSEEPRFFFLKALCHI